MGSMLDSKDYLSAVQIGLGENPYHSLYKKKSQARKVLDNIFWLERHGEVNRFYYCYQLDNVNVDVRKVENCIPYNEFRRLRDTANRKNPRGRESIAVLRNKTQFEKFMLSNGIRTPITIASVKNGEVTSLTSDMSFTSFSDIRSIDLNVFCKPIDGIQGKGAFSFKSISGKPYVNDKLVEWVDVPAFFSGNYMVQQVIEQHDTLSKLHPSSVNTIRIITVHCPKEGYKAMAMSLRVGTASRKVDNWASGGVVVKVDPLTGRLSGPGYFKPGKGGLVRQHPDTCIDLDGYQLPYIEKAIEMCLAAHTCVPLHSVGWDIAILEDGPILIEGNDNWDGAIPMTLDPDFAERYIASLPKSE